MQALLDYIDTEGRYLGNSILKVDSFLNHQVDASLMQAIGENFTQQFSRLNETKITKVLTAEASGIMPALTTAQCCDCRMIYARKTLSKTMVDEFYSADAVSRTRGDDVTLRVNSRYLTADDTVLIIDDFLAAGSTALAMIELVKQAGATLAGVGFVIEKPNEHGRERLKAVTPAPIATLACITFEDDQVQITPGACE